MQEGKWTKDQYIITVIPLYIWNCDLNNDGMTYKMTQFATTFYYFSSVFFPSDDFFSWKIPGSATFSKSMTFCFVFINSRHFFFNTLDYTIQTGILLFFFDRKSEYDVISINNKYFSITHFGNCCIDLGLITQINASIE